MRDRQIGGQGVSVFCAFSPYIFLACDINQEKPKTTEKKKKKLKTAYHETEQAGREWLEGESGILHQYDRYNLTYANTYYPYIVGQC